MAKKTNLPMTTELLKQVSSQPTHQKSKEDYISLKRSFEALDVREQERVEIQYRLKQIENLLLMIYEKP
jgi:hypothetical protein